MFDVQKSHLVRLNLGILLIRMKIDFIISMKLNTGKMCTSNEHRHLVSSLILGGSLSSLSQCPLLVLFRYLSKKSQKCDYQIK